MKSFDSTKFCFLFFLASFSLLTLIANGLWYATELGYTDLANVLRQLGFQWSKPHFLGAEYYAIAKSLVNLGEFSNPFHGASGPTAWCSPLFTTVLAAIYVFGQGDTLAMVVLNHFLAIGLTTISFTLIANHFCHTKKQVVLFLVAMSVVMIPDLHWYFARIQDCTFLLFISTLCWWATIRTSFDSTIETARLGLLGGIAALASPVLGISWLVSCFGKKQARSFKVAAILLSTSGLVLVPWTVRNFLVLDAIVPVKSNAGFELYQAQVLLPDGLIEWTREREHPAISGSIESKDYIELGEVDYVRDRKARGLDAIYANPGDYLRRTLNRLLAATVILHNEGPKPVPIVDAALYLIPMLAVGFLIRIRSTWTQEQQIALLFAAAYLIPFVALSYFQRYAVPIATLKIMFVFWVLERILDKKIPST